MKQFSIFRCEKDDCWIVSVRGIVTNEQGLKVAVNLGVAECPDGHTAQVVFEALQTREKVKYHNVD